MTVLAEELPGFVGSLIPYFGVPGAMLTVLMWFFFKGWVITGREATEARKQHDADMAEWAARYADMKAEKDEWRKMALDSMRSLEIATKTVEKSANVLERKQV